MRTVTFLSVAALGFWSFLQVPQPRIPARDAVLDMLVWGTHVSIDVRAYDGELRTAVEEHLRRAAAYKSARPLPSLGGLEEMVHMAWVNYERRLVAASKHPDAARLAQAYVDSLRPCYEWEGLHECPEHEASFADEYQSAHPDGPFSAFLPLLAAHRWLCTAEAYQYEDRWEDALRCRRKYMQGIAVALRSRDLLFRVAAETLAARGRCRSEGGSASNLSAERRLTPRQPTGENTRVAHRSPGCAGSRWQWTFNSAGWTRWNIALRPTGAGNGDNAAG